MTKQKHLTEYYQENKNSCSDNRLENV